MNKDDNDVLPVDTVPRLLSVYRPYVKRMAGNLADEGMMIGLGKRSIGDAGKGENRTDRS